MAYIFVLAFLASLLGWAIFMVSRALSAPSKGYGEGGYGKRYARDIQST